MILDDTLIFSDAQAVTADAGSTNVIDIGAAGTAYGASAPIRRDIGIGTSIPILICITEAFNNLTSITFSLQVDDNAAFSSATTVVSTGAIALASLGVGARIPFPQLPEGTNERYVRLYYDITGAAPTTGKIIAGVVAGLQTN
jgi:hypothetical protein